MPTMPLFLHRWRPRHGRVAKGGLALFHRDDGKGFIGIHSAAITFTGWPEYGEMLGGYFDGHPWGQFNAPLAVEDTEFPGMKNFPSTFSLFDEVYQIKNFSRRTCAS